MRKRAALAVCAGAAAVSAGVGLIAVAAWLIARAAAQPPVLELMVAVVAVRALGISKGMFRYVERLLSHDVAFRGLATLRRRVYEHLVQLAPAGLTGWRRGDLLTRLVDDVTTVQDRYVRVLVPGLSAMLGVLLAIVIAAALLPVAGFVLALGLIVGGVLVPWASVATTEWADRRLVADRGEMAGRIVESLDAADELRVLGAMPHQRAQIELVARRLARSEARLSWVRGLTAGLGMVALGVTIIVTVLAALAAVRDGRLDGPGFAVVALLPIAAFDAVGGLAGAVRDRPRVAAALARVDEVMAAPIPVRQPLPPLLVRETPLLAREKVPLCQDSRHKVPFSGLVARNLYVRWPGSEVDAVQSVDLDLPPGRRIAIAGPSGAGKSSILAALTRFCPYRGDITLSGVPLTEIDEQTLRRSIGLAAADAHIFDSTLLANLVLARPGATDSDIESALARAGLLEWVDSLPQGLHTPVGDHGRSLSGGQRQRLALARALLADLPVLLCDEPDSSVEPALADRILADLLDVAGDRSLIVVTHRLSGVESVDEILVMDAGRVVDRRSPAPAG